MTWTNDDRKQVTSLLLGSWPGTMAAWGREAIAAYLTVLEARGLTAEQVQTAILGWPAGSDFPPSAPNLAAGALHDPSVPTFAEMLVILNGPGGILNARTQQSKSFWEPGERDAADAEAIRDRARKLAHPLVLSFIDREGIDRMRSLGLDDPDYGEARRRQLEQRWEQHLDVMRDRDVHAIATGGSRRGELGHVDPLAALGRVARPPAGVLTDGSDR